MKKLHFRKGFTLIELLVVIGIIAVMASIIMALLSEARNKGADGAIKQNLASLRSQGEVFYNTNTASVNSYTNFCDTTCNLIGGAKTACGAMTSAFRASGLSSYARNAIGTISTATCNDTALGWAAEVPLKNGGMWCVDNTGKSTSEAAFSLSAAGDITCI